MWQSGCLYDVKLQFLRSVRRVFWRFCFFKKTIIRSDLSKTEISFTNNVFTGFSYGVQKGLCLNTQKILFFKFKKNFFSLHLLLLFVQVHFHLPFPLVSKQLDDFFLFPQPCGAQDENFLAFDDLLALTPCHINVPASFARAQTDLKILFVDHSHVHLHA